MKKPDTKPSRLTFQSVPQADVPRGRNGKHHKIVYTILSDVESLAAGNALKIPITALEDTKENIRAALSRETRKRRTPIETAADEKFLYVWRTQ